MDKATKVQTIERLRKLREIELANSCSYGFRFYLDRIIGGYIFYEGARPTNWQKTPKKLRELIKQSKSVQALVVSGKADTEIGKSIVLEHAYTIRELRRLVIDEKYEEAIAAYDVRFVTRDEDKLLESVEKQGHHHTARYSKAGIKF
ncbi:MAG: hypothetical protein KF766_08195 [Rhodocyclaceae bacterium]|nr:hypothetical protein [Rhodocyclaceae bacterium]